MNDLFQNHAAKSGPVECLGQTFPSDAARREHYLKLLAEKLKDPTFRKIEGFPIGSDEDILALSDPPYYTACPNPFIEDFVRRHGKTYDPTVSYSKEPFAADVSEGKNDPVYLAHSYHTKVPHKAIMRYILHYTSPGDVILDGFCGTGMTGVAAQMCGNSSEVASLGYQVSRDGTILELASASSEKEWRPISKLGARVAVLNDLSPAASFIAFNYNSPQDPEVFTTQAETALQEVERSCAWMFQTLHAPTKDQINSAVLQISKAGTPDLSKCGSVGRINYTLWSDVFTCPECAGELIFWDAAVNPETNQVMDEFSCPHCSAQLNKNNVERVWVAKEDLLLGRVVRQVKQVPALISYVHNKKKREKKPDEADLALLEKIDSFATELWQPNYPMMFKGEGWGDTWRAGIHAGITHVHHFYSRRNLLCLAKFRAAHSSLPHAANLTSTAVVASRLYRFRSQNGSLGAGGGPMSGTLYLPSLVKEIPALKLLDEHIAKATRMRAIADRSAPRITNTGSMSGLSLPDSSVDYIFLDPPFGSNIMYSELNFMWESWLKVFTNTGLEAIENKAQSKTILDYRKLMTKCFSEAFRVLKPGRWMTVEFSNTQATVWNAIQTSLQEAGFVVANVSALDKKQGSFKAVTTTTAVKQDLVISAYKPNGGLEERFAATGGSLDSVWDFTRTHLHYLPRVKTKGRELEFIAERDPRIIFDRMVAWFIRHNQPVPMSTQEFQSGLTQRFVERDGMVFLQDQVAEYDKKRAQVAYAPQMEMFVSDERSAIDWLSDFLKKRPSTYQEITPEFMGQLGGGWKKHEAKPELSALLDDNFLKYDGTGDVPSQIHSYLSTNHKDLRGLEKNSPALVTKAKDRWYVPDPNKAQDLEKKREKALLKEFEAYRSFTGRKIKESRLEVLRAGFRAAWATKDYKTIISIANKLPEETLQEDEKLLTLYDLALTRTEDGI
jgi:hypothetical protein